MLDGTVTREIRMNPRRLLLPAVAAVVPVFSTGALAESLRCERGIAAEGDTRLAVVYKCGQPVMRDSYCAPVYYQQSLHLVPEPIATLVVPCIHTEEWLYERGPGNLLATVRLRSGKVQSITYGHTPR
jgi:Protein of unknown function (DUF2845)